MHKQFILLFVFFALFVTNACSTQSKNIIKHGEYYLKSGQYKLKKWDDSLMFKRYTYYQDLSVKLDIKIALLNNNSNFINWLNFEEKEKITSCKRYYITMIYDNQGDMFKTSDVLSEFLKHYKLLRPRSFIENIKRHPSYRIDSLDQYDINGFCADADNEEIIELNMPGFLQLKI